MAPRMPSPVRSETEFDIGTALFAQNDASDDQLSNDENANDELHKPQAGRNDGSMDFMGAESGADDEAIIAAQQVAANRKSSNLKGNAVKKGGGFHAMGLGTNLLKAIIRKGFSKPTPIQRRAIPLLLKEKDVVGMARTGSGKTAAFVIPMIEKLKIHSIKIGARALILSPSRELALQTLQVVKEFGKGTDLRAILLVGGDSLEDQFSSMASNPDIIIATPGRFLHLKVEMGLDLSSIRYVVFDEADRLFEMGFAAQLSEILYALPASRQTLLFSATLPKSLVEFARAGLQDPVLVRLDADSKVSPDLQSAFFTVKSSEKEGALLHILQDVIKIPTSSQLNSGTASSTGDSKTGKKRKRDEKGAGDHHSTSNPFSTIIFAATKHHVEYLSHLLQSTGYAVSHVYGSLDQTARKMQVQAFRNGETNLMIVTDVAARGIDIPILANVINFDFPPQPKVYLHRVGRTARAGQKGWSYSIVRDVDAAYLLDLQLFLGRKLIMGRTKSSTTSYSDDVIVGSVHRDALQNCCEWVNQTLDSNVDLVALRSVAAKGEKLYQRTRNSASAESAKRAKAIVASPSWNELHPLFSDEQDNSEVAREAMLARVSGFRPQESIFEIGARRGGRKNNEEAVDAIRKIRSGLESKKTKSKLASQSERIVSANGVSDENISHVSQEEMIHSDQVGMLEASDSELEVTFSGGNSKKSQAEREHENPSDAFRNTEYFMSYAPTNFNIAEDKAYGVHSGSNATFAEAARGATMDLAGDEGAKNFGEARGIMRWDKRSKKYVARQNDEDGSKGSRLVVGESGAKIAASFRSGRYEAWRKSNKISRAPRVGEAEAKSSSGLTAESKRYRHKSTRTPKASDKYRDNFESQRKKVVAAKERGAGDRGKQELRSVDEIRKRRSLKEKRREKNARPSKKANK